MRHATRLTLLRYERSSRMSLYRSCRGLCSQHSRCVTQVAREKWAGRRGVRGKGRGDSAINSLRGMLRQRSTKRTRNRDDTPTLTPVCRLAECTQPPAAEKTTRVLESAPQCAIVSLNHSVLVSLRTPVSLQTPCRLKHPIPPGNKTH